MELDLANLIITAAGVILSFLIAKQYGDVAATKALIEREEKKDAKARITTLQALFSETVRIKALMECNTTLDPNSKRPQAIAHLPTETFRAAILSSESGLYSDEFPDLNGNTNQLITLALTYITGADLINSRAATHQRITDLSDQAGNQRLALAKQIVNESKELRDDLDQLSAAIRAELANGRKIERSGTRKSKVFQHLLRLFRKGA